MTLAMLGYGPDLLYVVQRNGFGAKASQILASQVWGGTHAIYLERGFDDARDFIHKHRGR